ncbi:OLC1v1023954C1 [Oldenlandia corymbosa var. corymbosa]|uniref:OLC1v1023954C1 n=1 Tax=Oldenlandia corymbosa var. corymbosa TaxID=529605 RepID=A0AAV1C2M0_OLDCO|nr:OLC1v1023954C1 [Oldenlandia corymbosa var. corymbosa]
MNLCKNSEEKRDLQIGESSSRISAKIVVSESGIQEDELKHQAKTLSDLLSINPSRKKVGVSLDYVEPEEKNGIQIAMVQKQDVQSEMEYWQPSIISFVLGANPPFKVMESFYTRISKHLDIDRVILFPAGLYVIRFKTVDSRDEALADPVQCLGSNPVIIKPWKVERGSSYKEVKHVPVWVQFPGLELKFWNLATLSRIANEEGNLMEQDVYYEWRPTQCKSCCYFRHGEEDCRKKEKPKEVIKVDTGHQMKRAEVESSLINLKEDTNVQRSGNGNSFSILAMAKDDETGEEVESGLIVTTETAKEVQNATARRGNPLDPEVKLEYSKIVEMTGRLWGGYEWCSNGGITEKGRILLIWNPGYVKVHLMQSERQLMHCGVELKSTGVKFLLTAI